jgi:hypothetical protein
MGAIVYNLNNAATLAGMAPPTLPGGAFGPATLPPALAGAGAGIYMIVNTNTNNRYIGISTNLPGRFNTRMATVTECGFATPQMNQIEVFWGTVSYQNSPGYNGIPAHMMTPLAAYGAPLQANIDGQAVNFERLLIRFALTQLGAGGTVSNNAMAFPTYANPTGAPIQVTLNWGASPTFAAGTHQATWPAGGNW